MGPEVAGSLSQWTSRSPPTLDLLPRPDCAFFVISVFICGSAAASDPDSCWEWWPSDWLTDTTAFLVPPPVASVHESSLTKQLFHSAWTCQWFLTRSGWSCECLWSGFASRFTTGPPHGVDVEPNKCFPVSLCWCEFVRRFDLCKLFKAFQNCFCWPDLFRFSFDFHLYMPLSEFFLLSIF